MAGMIALTTNQMLSAAIALAAKKFDGTFDKGGQPYILHCLKVMHYVRTDDHELQAIAVLHDIVEDTDTSLMDLELMGFSRRVRDGVRCMTKTVGITDDRYFEQIAGNRDAIIVKLADLRHNSDIRRLKGLRSKDIERLEKYHRLYTRLKALLNQPDESTGD